MKIIKDSSKIYYLYHYTPKENVDSIISSGVIKSKDPYTFFTNSYYKSVQLFEDEMMTNKLHVTIDKKIERRSYANPDDYRIIKIPYHNDGKFIKMIFDDMTNSSIYHISTIHEGDLYFDKNKVEVLPVSTQTGKLFFTKLFTKLAFLMMVFINPIMVKADTWLDSEEYYDISWFDPNTYETTTKYTLRHPEQVAGLSYVTNRMGYNFDGKDIVFKFEDYCENPRDGDCSLNMEDHDWVPLASNFQGILDYRRFIAGDLCGVYRLLLATSDPRGSSFINGATKCKTYYFYYSTNYVTTLDTGFFVSFNYLYNLTPENTENGTFTLDKTRGHQYDIVTITTNPDFGYTVDNFYINSTIMQDVEKIEDNKYQFKLPGHNSSIKVTFKTILYTIHINPNHSNVIPAGPLEVTSFDDQSFEVRAHVGYNLVGFRMNNGEIVTINDNSFILSNITSDTTIDIVVEPIPYHIENESIDDEYIFKVLEPFEEIQKIELCANNKCNDLEENDYIIEEQNIKITKNLEHGEYQLNVTFSNKETSSINFSIEKKEPIPANPFTKNNIIIVLFSAIFLTIIGIIYLKLKKED